MLTSLWEFVQACMAKTRLTLWNRQAGFWVYLWTQSSTCSYLKAIQMSWRHHFQVSLPFLHCWQNSGVTVKLDMEVVDEVAGTLGQSPFVRKAHWTSGVSGLCTDSVRPADWLHQVVQLQDCMKLGWEFMLFLYIHLQTLYCSHEHACNLGCGSAVQEMQTCTIWGTTAAVQAAVHGGCCTA